jgi:hypothetical protein
VVVEFGANRVFGGNVKGVSVKVFVSRDIGHGVLDVDKWELLANDVVRRAESIALRVEVVLVEPETVEVVSSLESGDLGLPPSGGGGQSWVRIVNLVAVL